MNPNNQTKYSFYRAALAAAVLLFIFYSPVSGQGPVSFSGHVGMVQDWSTRHAIYAFRGDTQAMMAAQHDPRALWSWHAANLRASRISDRPRTEPFPGFPVFPRPSSGPRPDWSIRLGATAGTAATMYPAKYSFDINATPNCTTDFVVYPVNAAGSGTQPNLVAFNNLYSGTVGGTGLCNRPGPPAGDDGVSATVYWSYNVQAIANGAVATSPVLSLDGAKVAFVTTAAGNAAHFHVLAWKAGDGRSAANLQNVLIPQPINAFSATAPVAGSGTATDLQLGALATGAVTLSSPFIDYDSDLAYVGNDAGNVYRIKDVFCTTAACKGSNSQPSLDSTWGTGGVVAVGVGNCSGTSSSRLTGPVLDFTTGNVYVGCADGRVYGFTPTGVPLANAFVAVGQGTRVNAFGAVLDPPLVDGVNGVIYAVSASGASNANSVLVQASTDLALSHVVTLGTRRLANMHAPMVNDAYFSSATFTTWRMYTCGYGGGQTRLYGVTFADGNHTITTGTPANANRLTLNAAARECSPLTEFLQGGTDRMFLSFVAANGTGGTLRSYDVTSTFPTTFLNTITETGGTSGIVVDNVSTQNQASSIYFSTLGSVACGAGGTGRCAVKLTQGALL